jgi:hypothetical protein
VAPDPSRGGPLLGQKLTPPSQFLQAIDVILGR